MKIFRAENPEVLGFIADTLTDFRSSQLQTDQDKQNFILETAVRLTTDPDNTCIYLAVDGDELISYIIGYVSEYSSAGWIDLAWAKPNTSHTITHEVVDRFCDWAVSKGKTEVRAETELATFEVWQRAYGFKQQALIIKKEL